MLSSKNFRKYYFKYGFMLLLGIGALIFVDYISLEIPRLMNGVITSVEKGEVTAIDGIIPTLISIALIVLGMVIGRFLWRYILFGTGRKVETDLREEMFIHATKLPQTYYSKEKIGGLMTYFIQDINIVKEMYGWALLMLVDGLVLGGLVLVRMFSLQLEMSLLAMIPIGLMGILLIFIHKKMEIKSKIRQESFSSMSDFAQESFTGITVIKAYVKEMKEALTFNKKSNDLNDKTMDLMKYNIIVNVMIDAMISLVILSILAYGSYLIASNKLGSGDLTEYISYFFTLLWPVFSITWFLNLSSQAKASAKRIDTFLNSKEDVKSHKDSMTDDTLLDGSISVNHLTFKHEDSEKPSLNDVSFEIKNGEMVGVLGKTGSGKSTLVELLLKVQKPDYDMIKFNGFDILDIHTETLRNQIGYVPQDNFLFSDTILNNIGFSKEKIDLDYAIEIAKLSDLHENVSSFELGYETILGERGTTISGGQKQRVSIARALAKDPKILILDDSVSAVDTKTEEKIINNLRMIRKNKTTIMIAHRISTVKKLDKILLFDGGNLIGIGSHQELLKTNPTYQEMVKRQELETLVGEEN